MKPNNLKTKIFLDSGDPADTKKALDLLGFLDGQTTNPSLVVKSPEVVKRISLGDKLSTSELFALYRQIAIDIKTLLPNGSVSVEVYANSNSTAEEMFAQAVELNAWINGPHIKLPLTKEGLKAAKKCLDAKMKINVTLCFSQQQAVALAALVGNVEKGDVFVSPFVGRLDDIGLDGLGLIKNIRQHYDSMHSNVEILSASVRSVYHLVKSIELGADIVTVPFGILQEWHSLKMPLTMEQLSNNLTPISFEEIDYAKDWQNFDLHHDLTDKGLKRFADDWDKIAA